MTRYSAKRERRRSDGSKSGEQPIFATEPLVSAGAAHDLGNYLQVIASAVRIMERSLSGETRAALDPVVRGANASLEHAFCLSRRISMARASHASGGSRVSIAERIASLEPVITLAAGPAVRLEFRIADAPEVLCDGEALDDAILNMVVNASHAMPTGGRLCIALSRNVAADGSPETVLGIADTGCGMDAAVAARAFLPGATTRDGQGGCGLGLANVHAFVRSAGGMAALDSHVGVGTSVTIRLPGVLQTGSRPRN